MTSDNEPTTSTNFIQLYCCQLCYMPFKIDNQDYSSDYSPDPIITKQPKLHSKKKIVWMMGDPGTELVFNRKNKAN